MATLWSFSGQQVRDLNGRAYPGAKAYFYDAGTTTDRSVYQDGALTTRHSQPVTADSQGRFPAVYVTTGLYRFRIVTAQDVSLGVDFDEITGALTELEPSGSVETNTTFQTGWPLFLEQTGTLTGFVRDNGRTIGSAASGATERANADVADLYAWYWEKYTNAICPVTTGRGASAAADFASNKAIGTLDKRGLVAVGLDDMGNLARNLIQVSTTANTTIGSNIVTVASLTGVAVDSFFMASGWTPGASVVSINVGASQVTLTSNAPATVSGLAVRFAAFRDAQQAGQIGGQFIRYVRTTELPIVTPTGTITVTQGTVPAPASTSTAVQSGAGTAVWTGSGSTYPTSGVSATFTGNALGSGLPLIVQSPGILGSWYRKI